MALTIPAEKGIPMPPPNPRPMKYPWSTMKVGDSFAFPADVKQPHANSSMANQRYAPKQFRVARTEDGWRCWRVK